VNCDRIARWYRWFEYVAFGRALEHRREAFLSDMSTARRALVLGDGDGRALAALLAAAPYAQIDYVDISARMLGLARQRADSIRVTFHHGDALTTPLPTAEFDLIVTHFFLDCLDEEDQNRLVAHVTRAATPQARWLVSEFRKPGLLVSLLYLFFHTATGLQTRHLADHHPLFERYGFHLARSESAWRGLLASELWERVE
jgi:ubiquinone/menaquinone biosynthesis C-methylase UbiE